MNEVVGWLGAAQVNVGLRALLSCTERALPPSTHSRRFSRDTVLSLATSNGSHAISNSHLFSKRLSVRWWQDGGTALLSDGLYGHVGRTSWGDASLLVQRNAGEERLCGLTSHVLPLLRGVALADDLALPVPFVHSREALGGRALSGTLGNGQTRLCSKAAIFHVASC